MHRILMACLIMGLMCMSSLTGLAQTGQDQVLMEALVESYDLLEAGRLAEAKQVYEGILEKHPDNPLALNNLGAIYVKEKNYQQALGYLERALAQAKGYKVQVNRVCDVEGVCLAFRPVAVEYGDRDLEPLIALNIEMVRAKLAAGKEGKQPEIGK